VIVVRGRDDSAAIRGEEFAPHTGEVRLDRVLQADGVFVNDAYYAPGARTHWHVHDAGQIIEVTSGEGIVATRGGDAVRVRGGDVVYAAPGEEHWHGAAPDCFVTYRSISLGPTTTNEAVEDAEHLRAFA
jgi:quercetin dioxygenase-like cupin family protein